MNRNHYFQSCLIFGGWSEEELLVFFAVYLQHCWQKSCREAFCLGKIDCGGCCGLSLDYLSSQKSNNSYTQIICHRGEIILGVSMGFIIGDKALTISNSTAITTSAAVKALICRVLIVIHGIFSSDVPMQKASTLAILLSLAQDAPEDVAWMF